MLLTLPLILMIAHTMHLNLSVAKHPMVDRNQECAKRIYLTNLPLLLPLKSMSCGTPTMILHGQLLDALMYAPYPSLLVQGPCTQASLSAVRRHMEGKVPMLASTHYPSHPQVHPPSREDQMSIMFRVGVGLRQHVVMQGLCHMKVSICLIPRRHVVHNPHQLTVLLIVYRTKDCT